MSVSEETVTLWTETGLGRTVDRKVVEGIKNIEVLPNITIKTPSIMVLDQLIEFLTESKEPSFLRCLEMILLAVHYDLLDLIKISAQALCREIKTAFRAELVYSSIQHLHGKYEDELEALWSKIQSIYPIYWVYFQTADGKSKMVPLGVVEGDFKKIILPSRNENNTEPYCVGVEYIRDMQLLEEVLKYRRKEIDLNDLEIGRLSSIVEVCCLLGYQTMFCDGLRILFADITKLMAEDIYNLLADLESRPESIEDYSIRMRDIQSLLSCSKWRNGTDIPMAPWHWKAKSEDNKFDKRIRFLPRPLLNNRLITYLAKNPMSNVMHKFLNQYPDEVTHFLTQEDCLKDASVVKLDVLNHLIHLASEFEYERMYFEAYSAILHFNEDWTTNWTLHGHEYTADDVFLWEYNGVSGLITLIAGDGTRSKIHRETLISESDFFANFFATFPSINEVPCCHCSDAVVLNAWIDFMIFKDLWEKPKKIRHFVELNRIADFYMVPGLLAQNLKNHEANFRAAPILFYNSIPKYYFMSPEDEEVCQRDLAQIVYLNFDLVCDSEIILNMNTEDFSNALQRSHLNSFYFMKEAQKLYYDYNLPHNSPYEFTSFYSKFRESTLDLIDYKPELKDYENRAYSGSGSVVMITSQLLRFDMLIKSHVNIYEREILYKIDTDNHSPLGYVLKAGGKIILLNSDASLRVYDVNDGRLFSLWLPEPHENERVKVLYWNEEIFAIGEHLWKFVNGEWVKQEVKDYGIPLLGEPCPIGDRLYFFSRDGDWTRYMIKSSKDGEEEDHLDFTTNCIEPTENLRILENYLKYEPILRFNFNFQGHYYCTCYKNRLPNCPNQTYSGLISNPQLTDRYILFLELEVLLIHADNWEIVERRTWPDLPSTEQFNSAVFTNRNLQILYHMRFDRRFVVYEIDFAKWCFFKTLEDFLDHDSVLMMEIPLEKCIKFYKTLYG